MRPVSDALLRSLSGSHSMSARARVVAPGQIGTDPDGIEIPILGGDMQLDWTAQVRSTLDLTTEPHLWPSRATDLLTPYGNEIFVERGVRLSNGVTEWVSLGYHRINTPDQDDAPHGQLRVAASDRMANIVDARLPQPRQYAATDTYGEVLNDLILDIYPDATIQWDDGADAEAIGRAVIAEEDRYGFANDLITSTGKVWWWDHRGILTIKDLPDITQPVWDVVGGEDGVLIQLARSLTRDGVYNGVVARGEAADTENPAWGIAVDDDPNSPTRWGGPFGKVPRFYGSPLLTSDGQAALAAASLLRRTLGLPYNVDFTAIPNPALEPLDPIYVATPGVGGVVHVVDRLGIPLVADQAMTGGTRQQTLGVIGQEA